MIDLVNNLKFESFEIIAIKQLFRRNKKPTFLAKNSKKTEKNKCELPHVLNYEKNRRILFNINLHCDTNEQSDQIMFYFRFKSVYLKFFNKLNGFDLQQFTWSEFMNIDELQIKNTMMQETNEKKNGFFIQTQIAVTQKDTTRQSKNLFIANVFKKQEEQEQYHQKFTKNAKTLKTKKQKLKRKQQELFEKNMFEKQKQKHEQYWQKFMKNANIIKKKQKLKQKWQKLIFEINSFEKQEQKQTHHWIQFAKKATSLNKQDQKYQNRQYKFSFDVNVFELQK